MIISVDHGNKNVKSIHKTFTSGLVSSSVPFSIAGDSLYYNGMYYALTEKRIPYMRDKTADDRFFILTLFAIAYELQSTGKYVPGSTVFVDLAVGLPPGHFGKQYTKFEQYFMKNKYLTFEFNKTKYNIYISSANAYPQGYAAIMPIYQKVKEYPRSVIIDIGGFSLDYLQLKNGKVDMSVCDSLELGVITLYNDIKSGVNSSEDLLIEECDIDAVIQNKPSVFEKRIRDTIEQKSKEFTDKIINSLRERQIDLKSTHAIFVGGGSILLEKYIRASEKIASPDIIKNMNANAAGYEMLLKIQQESGR